MYSNGGPEWIRTTEARSKGFTVLPIWPLWNRPKFCDKLMEPPIGFEPMTYGLQDRRSTSWAMVAHGAIIEIMHKMQNLFYLSVLAKKVLTRNVERNFLWYELDRFHWQLFLQNAYWVVHHA